MSDPLIIQARELSYHYGGEENGLSPVSFTLEKGKILAVGGANGCGKSTLLYLIAGVFSPAPGTLLIDGFDMAKAGSTKTGIIRSKVSLLLQNADMQIFGSTVEEDLLLSIKARKQKVTTADMEKAQKLAHQFGLEHKLKAPPDQLSYGQKRKVCLVSALLSAPDILLLDEPFSGLDYPALLELRKTLFDLKKEGYTIILSTHDLEPVAGLADNFLFIGKNGTFSFGDKGIVELAPEFDLRPANFSFFSWEKSCDKKQKLNIEKE